MQITLTITDNTAGARLLDDYCASTAWKSDSGITKADWMKQQLALHIKATSKRAEYRTAQVTINSQIDAIAIT